MAPRGDRRTARAWIAMQQNWWAYEEITVACERYPRKAWRLLGLLADLSVTDELVEILGAGPLEDFVRKYGRRYIRQLEQHAIENARFARALQNVRLPQSHDPFSMRLFALGCQGIKVPREAWQRR